MTKIIMTKNRHVFGDALADCGERASWFTRPSPPLTVCARQSESGVALTLAAAVHKAGVREARVVRIAIRLRRVRRMTKRKRMTMSANGIVTAGVDHCAVIPRHRAQGGVAFRLL